MESSKREYTKEEIAIIKEMRRKKNIEYMRAHCHDVKSPKIGRNDKCPCGSGLKYKKCCLNKDKGYL